MNPVDTSSLLARPAGGVSDFNSLLSHCLNLDLWILRLKDSFLWIFLISI